MNTGHDIDETYGPWVRVTSLAPDPYPIERMLSEREDGDGGRTARLEEVRLQACGLVPLRGPCSRCSIAPYVQPGFRLPAMSAVQQGHPYQSQRVATRKATQIHGQMSIDHRLSLSWRLAFTRRNACLSGTRQQLSSHTEWYRYMYVCARSVDRRSPRS